MPSRRLVDAPRMLAAREMGRLKVSHGVRPVYGVVVDPQHEWTVAEAPWLAGEASSPQNAIMRAHTALAAWLGVPFDSFDIGLDRPMSPARLRDARDRLHSTGTATDHTLGMSQDLISRTKDMLRWVRRRAG